MGIEDSRHPPMDPDQKSKRRMVLRKIDTREVVRASAPSLPPVRPPVPSHPAEAKDDDNELAPLPPRRMKEPVPLRSRPAAPAPQPLGWGHGTSTLRPPPPPDSTPDATPIPLTRLQPSRGRYQSAIAMEADAPADLDEVSNRDSSASTTLPPLVASLAPPAASLYVSRNGGRPRVGRALVVGGGVALLVLFAVLGGVAVGQHVAHSNDTPAPLQVATRAATVAVAGASPSPTSPAAVVAPQARTGAAPVAEPAAVDSLPRGAVPAAALTSAPAVERKAAVVAASLPPRTPPAAAGPVAAATAAPAAAAPAVASNPAPDTAKPAPASETSESHDVAKTADDSKTAPADRAPAAEAPAAAPDPAEDPLMRAMRQSLAEEQARAKQR